MYRNFTLREVSGICITLRDILIGDICANATSIEYTTLRDASKRTQYIETLIDVSEIETRYIRILKNISRKYFKMYPNSTKFKKIFIS